MSFVSTILFKLYRWSLRHSGAATPIEYEHTTKVPLKAEYIGPVFSATTGSAERFGVPTTGTRSTWHTWRVNGPKN